jgi:two-component system, LytTR family, response regulator
MMSVTSSTGPWRTIVVDDEPLARQTLRQLLAREKDFTIVAECGHGADAIAAIGLERPDVVFLDVQMPEVDGFDVLSRLEPGTIPAVIFVTAFDRYALRAFERHALDYLLKPFSDERFAAVLAGTRARLRERTVASMASEPRQLVVRDGGRTFVIPHDDIVWIEAEDYCVRIHRGGRTVLVRDTLRALELALDVGKFVRVHRSAIANVTCIRELEPLTSGDQRLTMSDGTVLKVSRTYRAQVVSALCRRRGA